MFTQDQIDQMQPRLHAGHMEIAVADLLDYRTNLIVPNVSYGWGLAHEADLIVVSPKNKVTEVEIKVSRTDLLNDLKKDKHTKPSKIIGRLIYAIPVELKEVFLENFPRHYGLITVAWTEEYGWRNNKRVIVKVGYKAKWEHQVNYSKTVQPIDDKKKMELQRLGCMRIWSLKAKNSKSTRPMLNPSQNFF